MPYDLRTRFDIQIKNTALTFRQIYGAWVPSRNFGLYVGLLKPPRGLEIDSSVFEQPFTDRGILSCLFTKEYHELGAKAEGWIGTSRFFYGVSLPQAPEIHGVNWADARDNFVNGDLQLCTGPDCATATATR